MGKFCSTAFSLFFTSVVLASAIGDPCQVVLMNRCRKGYQEDLIATSESVGGHCSRMQKIVTCFTSEPKCRGELIEKFRYWIVQMTMMDKILGVCKDIDYTALKSIVQESEIDYVQLVFFLLIVVDGDCFFRSVSHQIFGSVANHLIVRLAGVEYLRNHCEEFVEFFEGQSWLDYLSSMCREGTWCDALMVQAVANAYNLRINIVESGDGFSELTVVECQHSGFETRRSIVLGHVDEYHYVSTIPLDFCGSNGRDNECQRVTFVDEENADIMVRNGNGRILQVNSCITGVTSVDNTEWICLTCDSDVGKTHRFLEDFEFDTVDACALTVHKKCLRYYLTLLIKDHGQFCKDAEKLNKCYDLYSKSINCNAKIIQEYASMVEGVAHRVVEIVESHMKSLCKAEL
ncbi:hypothetical protein ACROYT_G023078 [Oculina patagonica]